MLLKSRSAVIAGLLWIATGAFAVAQPQTTPQSPQASADPAAARRISGKEALQAVAKGDAVLVDVRAKDAYEAGHAKGAISLPLTELPSRADELPKDKLVITYCT
jgi:3-mercaptopyruvate sulfurtransferase SseA